MGLIIIVVSIMVLIVVFAVKATVDTAIYDGQRWTAEQNLINSFRNSEFTYIVYNELLRGSAKGQLWSIEVYGHCVKYKIACDCDEYGRVTLDEHLISFQPLGYQSLNMTEIWAFRDALAEKLGDSFFSNNGESYEDTMHARILYKHMEKYISEQKQRKKAQSPLKKTH